jgi:hypothetical protein
MIIIFSDQGFEMRLLAAAFVGNDHLVRAEKSRAFVMKNGLCLISLVVTSMTFASMTISLISLSLQVNLTFSVCFSC